jgi:hypothetical protein
MSMEKIDYLLKYLSELQTQSKILSDRGDDAAVQVTWTRIVRINDLIEAELTKP